MGLSPKLSFHGCVQASSFVFLRAVRAWAAPSSEALTSCVVESNGKDGILVFPKSSSGVVRITRPKPASCATCGASLQSGVDLQCGAKSFLSIGTRSRAVRVFFISSSNSTSKSSLIGIVFLRDDDYKASGESIPSTRRAAHQRQKAGRV